MKTISVFDTTVSSYNMGNDIIMDSVNDVLFQLFPNDFFFKHPIVEITKHTTGHLSKSDYIFFGGTNSLSSNMLRYRQWNVNLFNYSKINNVILLGLGWWQYQKTPSSYTRFILNKVLSKTHLHATRDKYTENNLRKIGLTNIVTTGCPTLWDLTEEHCSQIPKNKSDKVILTFTDYRKDVKRDTMIYNIAKKFYKKIFIWLQGQGDYEYIKSIFDDGYEIIPPNTQAFNDVLKNNDIDYLGTRLHAGIRALQFKRRTFIIGIDNRALEMQNDFGLPVISYNNLDSINDYLSSSYNLKLNLPWNNIEKWKMQFK